LVRCLDVRVLVVGGTGFISRHAVVELLHRGHAVTIFHRGQKPNPFGNQVVEILGDRLLERSVQAVLRDQRFDAVVDVAYAWDSGTGAHEVSFIVDALRGPGERYVYLSSVSVYGDGPIPLREESPRDPMLGSYSEDKIGAEDYLLARHAEGRLAVSIIRPPFVYGPWNNLARENWFWDRIVAGRPVILPDRGETLFHWAAAKDVAWALAECVENPSAKGEAFNIGDPEPVTHAAFVDRLGQIAGRSVEKVPVPRARIRELGGNAFGKPLYFGATLDAGVDFSISIDKARGRLGFRPTRPEDGFKESFDWYLREDRETRSPTFSFDKLVLGR
jgi:nucleoside-diphosphate-sugar epimerase